MKKGKTAYTSSPHTSTHDPNAMDVDKKNTSTCLKKLTNQEQKKLMEENRCFTCHEKGHMATACPAKQTWRQMDAKKGKGKMREIEKEEANKTEQEHAPTPVTRKTRKPRATSSKKAMVEEVDDKDSSPPAYSQARTTRMCIKKILRYLLVDN